MVDAIAKELEVDLIDVTTVHEKDLSEYDLIGFASGIYAAQFHQQVKNFAQVNLPQNKKIFYIMTSAMNKDFSKSMADSIKGKNAEEPYLYWHNQSQENPCHSRNKESAVNQLLTIRNWAIGYYIVEFEQNGKARAEYGSNLLEKLEYFAGKRL